MADPRDLLLSRLHTDWLKPKGYRKKGRTSKLERTDGLITSVVLESGPAVLYSTRHFGIDLQATHVSLPANRRLITLSLRKHVEQTDRWEYEYDAPTEALFEQVESMFASKGVALLNRMHSIEGLASLFQELDAVFLSESHAWCLDR